MGTAGSDYAELRRCISAGLYANAVAAAFSMTVVPLDAALDLTMLAAEKKPGRYEEMARRWFCRWVEETEPGLAEINVALTCLARRRRPPV